MFYICTLLYSLENWCVPSLRERVRPLRRCSLGLGTWSYLKRPLTYPSSGLYICHQYCRFPSRVPRYSTNILGLFQVSKPITFILPRETLLREYIIFPSSLSPLWVATGRGDDIFQGGYVQKASIMPENCFLAQNLRFTPATRIKTIAGEQLAFVFLKCCFFCKYDEHETEDGYH